MMEYTITTLPDECHTKVTLKYRGKQAEFTFLHHEDRKIDSLYECFAFILDSAARWDMDLSAVDYLMENFNAPYTDEQVRTAQYEAGLWRKSWENLRFLFDEDTIDLIGNLVGDI